MRGGQLSHGEASGGQGMRRASVSRWRPKVGQDTGAGRGQAPCSLKMMKILEKPEISRILAYPVSDFIGTNRSWSFSCIPRGL